MIPLLHRISKAVAVVAAGGSVLVADVAAQTADVTADGTIVANEWRALGYTLAGALVVFLAPKNTETSSNRSRASP